MLKRNKFLIDILLLCSLLIAFFSGKALTGTEAIVCWIVHIAVSIAFVILLCVHLAVNGRGWFDAGKNFFRGEKYKWVRGRYVVDWLLMIIWGVVLVSGIPAIFYKLGDDGYFLLTKAFHSGFSTLGIVLIIVHVFQHKKQIKAYLSKQKNQA